jgi:hypothetical protein
MKHGAILALLAVARAKTEVSKIQYAWHRASGLWSLRGPGSDGAIYTEDMFRLVLERDLAPVTLPLADVCHKDMSRAGNESLGAICGRKAADARRNARGPAELPGVVVETSRNPCGLRYRMLDGSHRICRLKQGGAAAGRYYVLAEADMDELLVAGEPARRAAPRRHLTRDQLAELGWKLAEDYYATPAATALEKPP